MKNKFMAKALEQAQIAFENDEVPIGAVLVENGKIISAAYNKNRSSIDPTAHAEILVLREAATKKGEKHLENCDLYVTVEPCAMCFGAISLAKIRNVYYGAREEKFGAVESSAAFISAKNCYHKPEIYSGICEEEAKKLMQDFFKMKR